MVPPPLRLLAAGLRLAQPRGARDVRGRPALLAGPRRRRLPRRRGARSLQGGLAARPGRRRGRQARQRCRRDGRAPGHRRADVGPARGARRLPLLARHPRRVRPRPDGRRRGLDLDRRVDGEVHPFRRARPDLQLRVAARRVVGRDVRRGHHRHARLGRVDRRVPDVGAQQPRRDPPRHPLRRRRAGPGPRPRGHHDDARAARLELPLPGRGARPRAGRRRAGVPPGPVLPPHRRGRPRRLPGADPVERHRGAVRLRARLRPAVDPAAGRLGAAHRRGADRRPDVDAGVLPRRAARAPRLRVDRGRLGRGRSGRTTTSSRSVAARSPSCSTAATPRSSCPTARCCSRAGRSRAASSGPTRPPGSADPR